MLILLRTYAPLLAVALLAAPLLAIQASMTWANPDMVNERLPVNELEMEQHWQVNCDQTWQSLRVWAQQAALAETCSTPPKLLHALKLCAYIYQPPGAESDHHCPDYSGTSQYLEKGKSEGETAYRPCTAIRTLQISASDCR